MDTISSPQTGNIFRMGIDSTNSKNGKRLYKVWKGSNKFCCGGRLIFGPDVRSLFMTLVLIIAPVVVFCIFVGKDLMKDFANKSGIAIMVIAIVHTFIVLFFLILTSARDPGIIPRNSHPPEPDEEVSSSSDWSEGQTPKQRLPRTKDVIVNGISVKVKYCDTCMLYRPPRCSHCSICNNCVRRFDHHCPWVGQCIGQHNYPSFFMFVLSATLLCLFVLSMCALRIKKLKDGVPPHTVLKAFQKSPAAVFLMAYSFLAMWFVGGLTVFHLYLISTNQTTYENFRYRYDNRANAYNQGFFLNFKDVLCSSVPISKVNFRAKVQIETPGHGNFTPKKRETMDMVRLNNAKVLNKVETRGTSVWTAMPASQESYRPVNAGLKKEMKPWYESAFREEQGNFRTPVETCTQHNSQVHQGSNRRMTTEILGVSSAMGGQSMSKVSYPMGSYK